MKLSEQLKIVKDEEIARRYFVTNTFDGSLTLFGIIIAIYFSGTYSLGIIIISCLGASIAMAVSGVWGTYAIERAERLRSLKELERHLMRGLDETDLEKNVGIVTILVALVNGLTPILNSLIILSPFFASRLGMVNIQTAFLSSFFLIIAILFFLGVIIGNIARESIVMNGLKMMLAGICVGLIAFLLEYIRVL